MGWRAVRDGVAGEDGGAFRTIERLGVEPQLGRERPVEHDQARLADRRRRRRRMEEGRQRRVGVLEVPAGHPIHHTGHDA